MSFPPPQAASADLALASAILARDRKATARFVGDHSDAVHRFVWLRLCPRTSQVDDIVQEVFLAAWRSLKNYSGEASLRTWLLSIARHKVEDYYRKTLRESWTEADENTAIDPGDIQADMQSRENARRAAEILDTLPYEYAVVIRWRYWDGRAAREMAESMGRTEKAVERLLARARQRFKEEWLRKEVAGS